MRLSTTKAVSVPRLSLCTWRGGKKRSGVIHYDIDQHREYPHVVKFSGGRSSGLLLLTLLENNLLKPERGDVVIFSNTSAEHPATYDFVCKMKRATEKCNIPFFIVQLHTIETVAYGEWRRKLTYRLANGKPASLDNPYGYNYRGEVFEEAIAWNGMLPSPHARICTTLMKMFVTRVFLSDWFGGRHEIQALGHGRDFPQVEVENLYQEHLRSRGKMSLEEFANRYKILSNRTGARPAQRFRDYTKAKRLRKVLPGGDVLSLVIIRLHS